jgi:hypothetical protein
MWTDPTAETAIALPPNESPFHEAIQVNPVIFVLRTAMSAFVTPESWLFTALHAVAKPLGVVSIETDLNPTAKSAEVVATRASRTRSATTRRD